VIPFRSPAYTAQTSATVSSHACGNCDIRAVASTRFSGSANAAFLIFMPCPTQANMPATLVLYRDAKPVNIADFRFPSSPSESISPESHKPTQDAECVAQIAPCQTFWLAGGLCRTNRCASKTTCPSVHICIYTKEFGNRDGSSCVFTSIVRYTSVRSCNIATRKAFRQAKKQAWFGLTDALTSVRHTASGCQSKRSCTSYRNQVHQKDSSKVTQRRLTCCLRYS